MSTVQQGFRQDIQGLRALAVLLVVLDHAEIGPFHGGFIGVDVFFVISGFLITGLLVSEAERSGRVSLLGFYARRARRILPAATLVIVVDGRRPASTSSPRSRPAGPSRTRCGRRSSSPTSSSPTTAPTTSRPTPRPRRCSTTGRSRSRSSSTSCGRCWCCCCACSRSGGPGAAPGRAAPGRGSATSASRRSWSSSASRSPSRSPTAPPTRSRRTSRRSPGPGSSASARWPRAWPRGSPRSSPASRRRLSWAGLAAVVVAALVYDGTTLFPGYAAALPVLGAAALLAGGLRPAAWGPQRLFALRRSGRWGTGPTRSTCGTGRR